MLVSEVELASGSLGLQSCQPGPGWAVESVVGQVLISTSLCRPLPGEGLGLGQGWQEWESRSRLEEGGSLPTFLLQPIGAYVTRSPFLVIFFM